jgi:tetratricopeptide (TPR) repeat protein
LLLPAVLGEGLVGVALAAAVLVVAQTGWQGRFAVIAAGGLLVVGIYPLLDRTGEAIDALASDGFARSVWTVEHGLPLPAELARLSGKPDQRIVRSALAVRARREGRREEAVAAYAALGPGPEARNLNNAASLALAAGRNDDAITLLEAAARQTDIALVRVNLAQAYGAAVRLEQQELALAEAQSLDERGVRDLSRALNGAPIATTLDLPIGFSELAPALVDPAEASAITGGLRERVAPGWLGSGAGMAAAGWILSLGLGLLVGHRFGDSSGSTDYYAGMARLLKEGGVDAAERADRLVALREQQDRIDRVQRILAWLLPGAGGWLGGFPLLGLMACLALAGACALLVVAPLPDPHAIGAGTRWLSLGPALLLGGLYAALTAFSLRAGGSR